MGGPAGYSAAGRWERHSSRVCPQIFTVSCSYGGGNCPGPRSRECSFCATCCEAMLSGEIEWMISGQPRTSNAQSAVTIAASVANPRPPTLPDDGPADLAAGPSFRHPRTDATDPSARRLLDDGEHAKPLRMPGSDHRHQAAPRERARQCSADELRRLRMVNVDRCDIQTMTSSPTRIAPMQTSA